MTKTLILAVVSVVLVGCGPDFGGSFSGPIQAATSCSDGSGDFETGTVDWDIVDNGTTITLSQHGNCDPATGTVKGNVATLNARTCPPQTAGGITRRTAIVSGTLTLSEPNLAVVMRLAAEFTDGVNTLNCTGDITGALTRRR